MASMHGAANIAPMRKSDLSEAQSNYLNAIAAGKSEAEAVEAAGVTKVSVWRWKQNPAFAALIYRATRVLLELQAAPTAAKVLLDLANDEQMHPKIRLDAAKSILDRAGHAASLTIAEGPSLAKTGSAAEVERRYAHLTVPELNALSEYLRDHAETQTALEAEMQSRVENAVVIDPNDTSHLEGAL